MLIVDRIPQTAVAQPSLPSEFQRSRTLQGTAHDKQTLPTPLLCFTAPLLTDYYRTTAVAHRIEGTQTQRVSRYPSTLNCMLFSQVIDRTLTPVCTYILQQSNLLQQPAVRLVIESPPRLLAAA